MQNRNEVAYLSPANNSIHTQKQNANDKYATTSVNKTPQAHLSSVHLNEDFFFVFCCLYDCEISTAIVVFCKTLSRIDTNTCVEKTFASYKRLNTVNYICKQGFNENKKLTYKSVVNHNRFITPKKKTRS